MIDDFFGHRFVLICQKVWQKKPNNKPPHLFLFLFPIFFNLIFFFTEMTIQTSARLSSDAGATMKVERPFYEQQQFNSELNYCIPEDDKRTSCSQWIYNMKPTNILLSIFPVLSWLSQYNVKNDLIGDIISGCTVAIMHIPQGKMTKNPH